MDFKRNRGAWGFALFWSAFVLIFDAFVVGGLIEAVRSEGFDTTPGVVTKSEIKRGRKGPVKFDVAFVYTVNAQRYTGTEYHVQPQFVSTDYWFAARDANPVGAPVAVYYDPADPATACLAPGLRSDSLFLLWWLTPFNLVSVGFAWAGWGYLTGRRGFDPALRRCVRKTSDGWLVRPDPGTRFIVLAFVCLLAITFCGCFVCMGYVMIFDSPPPWALPLSMWAVVVAATVVFSGIESRRAWIHINELEDTITFRPARERVTVPRENILGLDITTEMRRTKSGPCEVHAVTLRWRDTFDQEQPTRLVEFTEAEDAVALVAWLSERWKLPTAAQVAV